MRTLLSTVIWGDISEAPRDIPSLFLYADEFRDEDFNPSGIVDGCWTDESGWIIWVWNGCQDCYDTVEGVNPTHFALKQAPADPRG